MSSGRVVVLVSPGNQTLLEGRKKVVCLSGLPRTSFGSPMPWGCEILSRWAKLSRAAPKSNNANVTAQNGAQNESRKEPVEPKKDVKWSRVALNKLLLRPKMSLKVVSFEKKSSETFIATTRV